MTQCSLEAFSHSIKTIKTALKLILCKSHLCHQNSSDLSGHGCRSCSVLWCQAWGYSRRLFGAWMGQHLVLLLVSFLKPILVGHTVLLVESAEVGECLSLQYDCEVPRFSKGTLNWWSVLFRCDCVLYSGWSVGVQCASSICWFLCYNITGTLILWDFMVLIYCDGCFSFSLSSFWIKSIFSLSRNVQNDRLANQNK